MTRHDRTAERADLYFAAYAAQSPPRSLNLLQRSLIAAGVQVSLPTLKRYSARYRWRERLAELAAEARQRGRARTVETILSMNERHTELARAMQGAGGTALQRLLTNDGRLAGLRAGDITRLIELGFRSERHAVSATTDRSEIALETWNDVIVSVVELFQEVNQEPDARTRTRLFARGLDALANDRLASLARRKEDAP